MNKKEGKAVVQTPIKRNQKKKKNKGIVIGASTALVMALVGGVFYTAANNEENETEQQNKAQTANEQVPDEQVQTDNEAPVNNKDTAPIKEEPTKEETNERLSHIDATKYVEGQEPATEPTVINGILLANKQYPLPQSYNPGVDPTAQKAMDDMIAAAKQQNIALTAFSGFRSYEYQQTLYSNYVARDGQENADRYSARPGYSEHQTGLAFDIGEVGKEDLWLTEAFGETAAGQWLVQHAHEYGFILRYPKGKEHLTGFMYESWHFRYVGIDVATDINEQGVTLEEYLGVYNEQPQTAPAEPTVQQETDEQLKVGAKSDDNK